MLAGTDNAWDPGSELLLMTAARVEHVRRVIGPALSDGKIVVSDRFIGSTIAYQGAGRGMSEEFIRSLHEQVVGPLWPDLTIILDLDVEVGLERSRRRLQSSNTDEGRFETLDLDFHQRIRRSYLDQAARDPERHAVIDAAGTSEETKLKVLEAMRLRLI
ncbi:dTMP kinase [Novosphingobium sp. G106]|uniref:dTMP kinase n=1 Tax=Novosphingobium sp. G106 TaxID=2849500 RepID=UPI0020C3E1E2|nr:dTMP kinase [Novosphingobium sp. G106]